MPKTRTVDPAADTVTVSELKSWALIDTSDDDTKLQSILDAAVSYCEWWTGRAFITQTWQYIERAFPSHVIELPRPPLQTITSVAYVDIAGSSQTLTETTEFIKDTVSEPGTIEPVYNTTWPDTRTETYNAVTVTYVAGFGDASTDVPEDIRVAIMMLGAHWYRCPEAYSAIGEKIPPMGFEALLRKWRVASVLDS